MTISFSTCCHLRASAESIIPPAAKSHNDTRAKTPSARSKSRAPSSASREMFTPAIHGHILTLRLIIPVKSSSIPERSAVYVPPRSKPHERQYSSYHELVAPIIPGALRLQRYITGRPDCHNIEHTFSSSTLSVTPLHPYSSSSETNGRGEGHTFPEPDEGASSSEGDTYHTIPDEPRPLFDNTTGNISSEPPAVYGNA